MEIHIIENEKCMLCGSTEHVLHVDWEKDGLQSAALCGECRTELKTKFELAENAEFERIGGVLSAASQRIADEAAQLTEEEFGETYLQDTIDRVVFEYIRGYGKMELDGAAIGMMALMLEGTSEETIAKHLQGLLEKGLVYEVNGRNGWYGADYPFSDDL